jgi:hypothetical protein
MTIDYCDLLILTSASMYYSFAHPLNLNMRKIFTGEPHHFSEKINEINFQYEKLRHFIKIL